LTYSAGNPKDGLGASTSRTIMWCSWIPQNVSVRPREIACYKTEMAQVWDGRKKNPTTPPGFSGNGITKNP
ncbi:unnamed protein product, partial [Musa textilis]